MNLRIIRWEVVDYIQQLHDRDQWQGLVNMAMNLLVLNKRRGIS
jgi:hypothetical protein